MTLLALLLPAVLHRFEADSTDSIIQFTAQFEIEAARQKDLREKVQIKRDAEEKDSRKKIVDVQIRTIRSFPRRSVYVPPSADPKPTNKKPAPTFKIVVKLTNEHDKPLPAGLPFRATWLVTERDNTPQNATEDETAKARKESLEKLLKFNADLSQRLQGDLLTQEPIVKWTRDFVTGKDGTIEIDGLAARAGFVSLDLNEKLQGGWSFTTERHAALVLANGKSSFYKIPLRREVVDYTISGVGPGVKLTLPNGIATDAPSFRLDRVLADAPGQFVILTDERDGIQRLATVGLNPSGKSPDAYSPNKVDARDATWSLNALTGLKHPFPAFEHRVSSLTDMLDLHKVEDRMPRRFVDWSKLKSPGDHVVLTIPGQSIEISARVVALKPPNPNAPTSMTVIESIRYLDTLAGDVVGFSRTASLEDVKRKLGPPDPNHESNDLLYFGGGLAFIASPDGKKVDAIEMRRPPEFFKQGLRPTPFQRLVAIGLNRGGRIDYIGSPTWDDFLANDSTGRLYKRFAESALQSFNEQLDFVRFTHDANRADLTVTFSDDFFHYERNALRPYGWEMKCTMEVYDRRTDRDTKVGVLSASHDYSNKLQSESVREQVWDDLIRKVRNQFFRLSRVGRVIGIDQKSGYILMEMDHADQAMIGDAYRLRNLDHPAFGRETLACFVGLARANVAKLELRKAELKGTRIVKTRRIDADLRPFWNKLLDPSTRLVFGDYVSTDEETTGTSSVVTNSRL